MKLSEIINAPTIKSCTMANGNIDRKKADRIIDPKGYFKKHKPKKKK